MDCKLILFKVHGQLANWKAKVRDLNKELADIEMESADDYDAAESLEGHIEGRQACIDELEKVLNDDGGSS